MSVRDARYWQQEALKRVGQEKVNALFELRFAFNALGGVFKVSFNDIESDEVEYPCSADVLAGAMGSMLSIGEGGAKVTGVLRGPYYIEIAGANAGQACPPLLVDGSAMDPPHEPVATLIRQGGVTDMSADAEDKWDFYDTIESSHLRMLHVAAALIEIRLGDLLDEIDVTTGSVNQTVTKGNQRYTNMLKRKQSVKQEIEDAVAEANTGNRRGFAGRMDTTPNGLAYGELGINPYTGRFE